MSVKLALDRIGIGYKGKDLVFRKHMQGVYGRLGELFVDSLKDPNSKSIATGMNACHKELTELLDQLGEARSKRFEHAREEIYNQLFERRIAADASRKPFQRPELN